MLLWIPIYDKRRLVGNKAGRTHFTDVIKMKQFCVLNDFGISSLKFYQYVLTFPHRDPRDGHGIGI